MDCDKIEKAIRKDAGQKVKGLRKSLKEMKAGKKARIYTPEQLHKIMTTL